MHRFHIHTSAYVSYSEVPPSLTHNEPHVSTGQMSRLFSFVLFHVGPCLSTTSQRLSIVYSVRQQRLTAAELWKALSNNKR